MKIYKMIILTIILYYNIFSAIGQSAVIALTFPFGARQLAMGEIGTALADDESCTYWNPAGLGVNNEKWRTGKFSLFFEPLLPIFQIPDLWHSAIAICYQPISKYKIGGFGFYWNFLNFGENQEYNADGSIGRSYRSYESIYSLTWGFPVTNSLYLGFATKYFVSALAPGTESDEGGDGVARSLAFDFGLLFKIKYGINFGLTLTNIGPAVSDMSEANADPIPFTVTLALAYQKEIIFEKFKICKISFEYNIGKEMVYNEKGSKPDPFYKAIVTSWQSQSFREGLQEIIHNWGTEITIFNTLSYRMGVLYDKIGSRKEFHIGIGLSALNHFGFNWYVISSENHSFARHGQFGISFDFTNLFKWSDNDFHWWTLN